MSYFGEDPTKDIFFPSWDKTFKNYLTLKFIPLSGTGLARVREF